MSEAQVKALRARADQLEALRDLLKDQPQKVERNGVVTVYIGDGYFVDLNATDATRFVSGRLRSLRDELDALCQVRGLSEEGLPIMDIFEELDQDGNVIKSHVEQTGSSLTQMTQMLKQLGQKVVPGAPQISPVPPEQRDPTAAPVISKQQEPVDSESLNRSPHSTSQSKITEIKEVTDQEAAAISKARGLSTNEATESSDDAEPRFNGISREDMLELELLQDHLADLDVDEGPLASEDEYDYDEDAVEDDEDDDDDDDDGAFSSRVSLFPQTERVQKLLEKTIPVKRASSMSSIKSLEKDAHVSKRSVTFGSNPDIHEFETDAAERLDPQFGGDPIYDTKPIRKVSFDSAVEVCEFETTSDERRGPLFGGQPVYDAQASEGAAGGSQRTTAAEPKGPSRFKMMRESLQTSDYPPVRTVEDPRNSLVQPVSQTVKEREPGSSNVHTPKPKTSRFKRNKAKPAPIPKPTTSVVVPEEFRGTGDIRVEDLPVAPATSLRDLEPEALKYFDQATIPDDDFVSLHDDNDDVGGLDVEGEDRVRSRARPDQPLMGSIVETPSSSIVGDIKDDEAVDMRAVRSEYQRLRQKMVQRSGGYKQTDRDQETEAIDADGNPTKVSRFKAARIGMR